ncbi:MAG: fimbria/pilus periplasmic chaperone [Luteibacter sp.]
MSRYLVAAVIVSLLSTQASAAIVIGGTRVVFPGDRRDVAVRIQNKGDEPALVQAWIDEGDVASTPQNAEGPFVITPPVFRVDPGHGHTLRIVHVGTSAPVDAEKLYWLNIMEIPPKADAGSDANVLQFAFRHRLKVLHRPKDLSLPVDRAASALRWSLVRHEGRSTLAVTNASPYVVSFNNVTLLKEGAESFSLGGGMVLPGATTRMKLRDGTTGKGATGVSYALINDFGAVVRGNAGLVP